MANNGLLSPRRGGRVIAEALSLLLPTGIIAHYYCSFVFDVDDLFEAFEVKKPASLRKNPVSFGPL